MMIVEIGASIRARSTTTLTIGGGPRAFTLTRAIVFPAGMTVTATAAAGNTMTGTVTGYDPVSRTLSVVVASITGGGSHGAWTIDGTTTLYVGNDGGWTTGRTDTPAEQPIPPYLTTPGSISRRIGGDVGGIATETLGQMELDNGHQGLDAWRAYSFDGRPLVLREGRPGAPYPAGWSRRMVATIERLEFSTGRVVIRLADRLGALARRELTKTAYRGDNVPPDGIEGTTDQKDLLKPVLLGVEPHFEPPWVNNERLCVQVADRAVHVAAVYEAGAALPLLATYSDLATFMGATVTAGWYIQYAGAEGTFLRFGDADIGRVTCWAWEGASPSDRTAAQVVRRCLIQRAGRSDAELRLADFTALDAVAPGEVGHWQGTDATTIGDVLPPILRSAAAWLLTRRDGSLGLAQIARPTGTPVAVISAWMLGADEEAIAPLTDAGPNATGEGAGLPPSRIEVRFARNQVTMTKNETLGVVGRDRLVWLKDEYRKRLLPLPDVVSHHAGAVPLIVETRLIDGGDAEALASYLAEMFGRDLDWSQLSIASEHARDLDIGDELALDLGRFDWPAMLPATVVGVTDDFTNSTTTLELYIDRDWEAA
ncbi:MAG: hypothetical protein ACT7A5_16075 [Ferrovibrionaceae bacterium]